MIRARSPAPSLIRLLALLLEQPGLLLFELLLRDIPLVAKLRELVELVGRVGGLREVLLLLVFFLHLHVLRGDGAEDEIEEHPYEGYQYDDEDPQRGLPALQV